MELTFEETIEIDVPAAAAWDLIADYVRDPQWRTGVVEMRPEPAGPVHVGTVTHETMRLGGRSYHNVGEVVAVEPGTRLVWRTTSGADADGSRSVRALPGDRCEVRLEVNARPHGADRLLAPILRRMLAKNLRRDLERLSELLVHPAEAPAPA